MDRRAAEGDTAATGAQEAGRRLEERGLSGAVGAEQDDELALADGDAHLPERDHSGVGDDEVVHAEHYDATRLVAR